MAKYDGQRAAVIGGSIGGLTAALLLRDLGFAVDVYERAARPLDGRGGGIILQPETLRWFRERSSHRPHTLCYLSSTPAVTISGTPCQDCDTTRRRYRSSSTAA
jgi:2,6-dihydroxypyridine 3-monooxygenase